MDITDRPPLIRSTQTPEIAWVLSTGEVLVGGVPWSKSRVYAAVKNYLGRCGCGRCNSCCVGRFYLKVTEVA